MLFYSKTSLHTTPKQQHQSCLRLLCASRLAKINSKQFNNNNNRGNAKISFEIKRYICAESTAVGLVRKKNTASGSGRMAFTVDRY